MKLFGVQYIFIFLFICQMFPFPAKAHLQCQEVFAVPSSLSRLPLDKAQSNHQDNLYQQMMASFRQWIRQTFLLDTKQKHQRIFDERHQRLLIEQKQIQAGMKQRFGLHWKNESSVFVYEIFQFAKNHEPRFFTDTEAIFLQGVALDNTLEFQFLTVMMKDLQYNIEELERQIQSLQESETYLRKKKNTVTTQDEDIQLLVKKKETLEVSRKSFQAQLTQDQTLLDRIKPLREQLFVISKHYDSSNQLLHLGFVLNKSVDDIVFDSHGKIIPDLLLRTIHW